MTLFERVKTPGPVGAGIMMQPMGLSVLARLGVEKLVIERGARVDRLLCENEKGLAVVDLAYHAVDESYFGVGLHRGVLFEALFHEVERSPVRLRTGVDLVRLRRAHHRRWLEDTDGALLGPFDLVVIADGARSRLRESASEAASDVTPYPWGALWYIADDPLGASSRMLHQRVRGTKHMVGLLPTGLGPGAGSTPQTSLFFSVRGSDVPSWRARGISAWRDHVVEIAPAAEGIVQRIASMEDLTYASYFDVRLSRWHGDGVVILGDAAHAMSPQLGQGCNLALYDAMVLNDALADGESLAEGLDLYTARRRQHLAFYQFATRWLTPLFQSSLEPLGWMRDLGMSFASKFSFVEREMVRSMCGTKTGLLWGSLTLPKT